MENVKKKYFAELSGITSSYFLTTSKSYKLFQQTPSKFSGSSLSEIFPDLPSKKQVRVSPCKPRPLTVKSQKSLERVNKKKAITHSENYEEFKGYFESLCHLKPLYGELHINYLVANANNMDAINENYLNVVDQSEISKEGLVNAANALTSKVREHIQANVHGKHIETLWRALLKVLDNSFIYAQNYYNELQGGLEEIYDVKTEEILKQYDKIRQESTEKIKELNGTIDTLKEHVIMLEQDIAAKSRIIKQKSTKIDEMNNFENRTFTIYRLTRMIKSLADFITETEFEQIAQEKALSGISKILKINEELNKPPETDSKNSQTSCISLDNKFNVKELLIPLLSLNPLYYYIKPPEKFAYLADLEIHQFCEEVLKKDPIGTFPQLFILNLLETGKDSSHLYEIINKLQLLENVGLKWPIMYRKLLGVDSKIIGKFWEFIKFLDFKLSSPQYSCFIDFRTAIEFLHKMFKGEEYVVHRVLFQANVFEPIEVTKSFQVSEMHKQEIVLMKLAFEIRKKKISLSSLMDPGQKKNTMISKNMFVNFIQSLPMYLNEKGSNDLWDYLVSPDQFQVHSKTLISHMHLSASIEKSSTIFLDKFDLIARLMYEWEKKQDKFFDCLKLIEKKKNLAEIVKYFKDRSIEVSHKTALEILISLHNPSASILDNTFPNMAMIKIPQEKKPHKL